MSSAPDIRPSQRKPRTPPELHILVIYVLAFVAIVLRIYEPIVWAFLIVAQLCTLFPQGIKVPINQHRPQQYAPKPRARESFANGSWSGRSPRFRKQGSEDEDHDSE